VRTILRACLIVAFASVIAVPVTVQAAAHHGHAVHTHTNKKHTKTHGAVRVILHHADCSTVSTATDNLGFAEINRHKNGGAQIEISTKGAMPNTSYRAYLLGATGCSVLYADGVLTTNGKGQGNVHMKVPAGTIPAGTTHLAVQLVSPATATVPGPGPFTDVITSSQT
jgi:hypothetical protein